MEFLTEYGIFLLKVITIALAITIPLLLVIGTSKSKNPSKSPFPALIIETKQSFFPSKKGAFIFIKGVSISCVTRGKSFVTS